MAISLVQTVQGNGGGYVNSYTKSITPTAGNMLTVCIALGAADVITVSDNKGNTWVADKTQILTSQRQAQVWRAYNVAGGATTITFQANSGDFPDSAVIIDEWSGLQTSAALDQIGGANTSSGTTYAASYAGATTQASELLIGCMACDSNSPSFTGDASWTGLLTQAGFDLYTSVTRQYRIVSSTGSYSWTLTNSASRQASQALASYKAVVNFLAAFQQQNIPVLESLQVIGYE